MVGGEVVSPGGGLKLAGGDVVSVGGLVVAAEATSIVTEDPDWTLEPADGLMLNTVPGVVPGGALDVTFGTTWKPWFCRALVAAA
jgi:hypothetical protein